MARLNNFTRPRHGPSRSSPSHKAILSAFFVAWARLAAYAAMLCFVLPLAAIDALAAPKTQAKKPKHARAQNFTPLPSPQSDPSKIAPPATAADPFGAVPAAYLSAANVAPWTLVYANDSMPVFGLPGTVAGPDISKRTQLTGDWGGLRTQLAHRGVFIDMYTTSAFVYTGGGTSGRSGETYASINNLQMNVNLDSGRLGLWSGGIFHFGLQGLAGSRPAYMEAAGAVMPAYLGFVLPAVGERTFMAHEYFFAQALTEHLGVNIGKMTSIFLADQTFFGSSFKNTWTHFSFTALNPLYSNYTNIDAWGFLAQYDIIKNLKISSGIIDPFTKPSNFADSMLKRANWWTQIAYIYDINGLPGQVLPQVMWNHRYMVDLKHSVLSKGQVAALLKQGIVSPQSISGQAPQTQYSDYSSVQGILGTAPYAYKSSSYAVFANISQYVYLKDDPKVVAEKMRSGQMVRGMGFFVRGGWGPAETNYMDRSFAFGLHGGGMLDERPRDQFGFGVYYTGLSRYLKASYNKLNPLSPLRDEYGLETFYSYAITPAISWVTNFQYIRNPTYARVDANRTRATTVSTRINIVW